MLQRIRRQVRTWRQREQLDDQLHTELQFHLDLEARRLVDQGVSPDEARRSARTRFGGVERVSEECRDQRALLWLDRTVRHGALCGTNAQAPAGVRAGRHPGAWPGHRGQHRDVQRHLRRAAQAAAVRGRRSTGAASGIGAPCRPGHHRHLDRRALRLPSTAHRLQRAGGVPPDVVRPAEPRRARPRRHRRGLGQLLRRARCAPEARSHVRRRRRRCGSPGGAGAEPRVLAHAVWRRPPHRRPDLSDERPAAHGRRRAAADSPVPGRLRRVHADVGLPVPRRPRSGVSPSSGASSRRCRSSDA